jgi:DNA-binding HxlR family transcriptional regulator
MSPEEFQAIIKEQVDKISKKCEIFSNPMRVLIVSTVLAEGETNWSQLKENIEKMIGSNVNPNTLSFHLAKLVEATYLQKTGTTGQPVYKIDQDHAAEIYANIETPLVEIIKKKVLA